MKIKHILKAKDFREILENGKKLTGRAVSLYIQVEKQTGKFPLEIGITTSKKHAARAVKRNYIKRFIYAEFRKAKLRQEVSIRMVVRLIKSVNKMTKKEIARAIRQDLKALCGQIDGIL
ncbi:MAG: ribonuclease P protein component [Candidatus Omnitrophica bacterium]|nr:ribonuclease P protein component [Candidatus Omnitrophota bacterium]